MENLFQCSQCGHSFFNVSTKEASGVKCQVTELKCLDCGEITPVYTVKEDKKCTACNGSGHYDSVGSPKCSCCDGAGVENANV